MEPALRSYFYKGQESIRMDTSNMMHVGHGSSVYITVNPAVLAHSCVFPWLHMRLDVVCVWLLWNTHKTYTTCIGMQSFCAQNYKDVTYVQWGETFCDIHAPIYTCIHVRYMSQVTYGNPTNSAVICRGFPWKPAQKLAERIRHLCGSSVVNPRIVCSESTEHLCWVRGTVFWITQSSYQQLILRKSASLEAYFLPVSWITATHGRSGIA